MQYLAVFQFVLQRAAAPAGVWAAREPCEQHRHLQLGRAAVPAQDGWLAGDSTLICRAVSQHVTFENIVS